MIAALHFYSCDRCGVGFALHRVPMVSLADSSTIGDRPASLRRATRARAYAGYFFRHT